MSKTKLFVRGVSLGYIALIANILYSLLSVPLALRYLDTQRFGLWAVVTTIIIYLALAELGMVNAFNRQLIEQKDRRENGRYGSTFLAGMIVFLGIGALVMLMGGISSLYLKGPFNIPANLSKEFTLVMLGQSAICAATLATTMLNVPLYIHQRQDLIQISQIILFLLNYFVLWFGFHIGMGIYAMLLKDLVGFLFSLGYAVYFCLKLRLYPSRHEFRRPSKSEFIDIFAYSRDSFMIQLGLQMVNGLPMLLLPKLLGLEAAASWAIVTRSFFILRQIISRPFDYGVIALCDMFVNGRLERMTARWLDVSRLMLAGAIALLPVAAANNARFIMLWTKGRIALPSQDHWLIGMMFLMIILGTSTIGMVGIDKKFGKIRYVHFAEALVTTVIACLTAKTWGLSGMILSMTISYFLLRFLGGMTYISGVCEKPMSELLFKLLKPALLLPLTCGLAAACAQLLPFIPGWSGLIVSATLGTLSCGFVVLVWGVPLTVKNDALGYFKPIFSRLALWNR